MNRVPTFQREMDNLVQVDGLKDTFPYLDNITVAGHTQEEHDRNVKCLLESLQCRKWTSNNNKTINSVFSINILGYLVGNRIIKPDLESLQFLEQLPPPTNPKSLKRVLGLFAYYAKWIKQFSEKIKRLKEAKSFPLNDSQINDFQNLKKEIVRAALRSVDKNMLFVIKCDALNVAILATLNQGGGPMAFMSKTLHRSELHYSTVEKNQLLY